MYNPLNNVQRDNYRKKKPKIKFMKIKYIVNCIIFFSFQAKNKLGKKW